MTQSCLACTASDLTVWATARDVEYFAVDETFDYLSCGECGALSIDPVPSDRLATIYPDNYYSYSEGKRSIAQRVKDRLDERAFAKLLASMSEPELSVLDVGGGNGRELAVLRKSDPRVTYTAVVDLDEGSAEEAQSLGHEYFCCRIEDFETDRRFDLILLQNLIEHVADPVSVLRTVSQCLTPNGKIFLKTPNHDALDARLFRHRNWTGFHCPRHWVLFDEPSFRTAAATAGLQIDDFRYIQGASFWAGSIVGEMTRLKMVRTNRERPIHAHPAFGLLVAAFGGLDSVRARFSPTSQIAVILSNPS